MPIRYPIAFRGTARPSVCSAWRLKVPKLGALPKPFAYFSLICSRRNPISCRKLGVLPKPFDCFSLICSRRNPISCRKLGALPKPFCLFQPYLFKSKPSFFVELGAVVHQRETSARFCHQRNLQAFFVTFCLFAF